MRRERELLGEVTPQQKAAMLAWWLAHGEAVGVEQAGLLLYGRVHREAGKLLRSLAQAIPIADDGSGMYAAVGRELQEAFSREQRAAVIAWRLACGEELTVMQVAEQLGIRRRGAAKLLETISAAIPVYDVYTGHNLYVWRVCDDAPVDDDYDE